MASPDQSPIAYNIPREDEVSRGTTPPILLLVLAGLLVPSLLAYSLATTNETQVVAYVFGILGTVLIIARPFWGLIFFTALLYLRPEESIQALAGLHFTLLIALVTLVGLVVHLLIRREPMVRVPAVGMIIGMAIVGTAGASIRGTGGAGAAMDLFRLVVVVLLILNLTRTPDRYQKLITALIFFTCYLAVYSAYLYYSGQSVLDEGLARSAATGIFSDPNDLAATMVAGMALAINRLIQSKNKARLSYIGICSLLLFAIFLTNSRGGLLALMVVIGGFFYTYSRRKTAALTLAAICAGLLLVVAAGSRMTNFDSQEESANSRFHFWDTGIKELVNSPLLGVGYKGYPDVNGGYVAHNSFVHCFGELGLPGYFFFMGCIYCAYKRRTDENDPETNTLTVSDPRDLIGARIALTGYLAAAFWISRTYNPILYVLMTLPLAQQIAYSGNSTLVLYPQKEKFQYWARIFGLCLGSIFFIWLLVLRFK